jgi:sarcosine oxidase
MAYDVAVIGLGVMGSAAAWRLARRGAKVLGLEQFQPGHDRGSSHGLTRVIRQAYFEHPAYVPLVLRAYSLWAELEGETRRPLFRRRTGAFMIGPEGSPVVRGSLESARLHGLPHNFMNSSELRTRFPFMIFREEDVAVEELEAGILFAEDAVLAMQDAARAHGAEFRFGAKAAIGDPPAAKTVVAAGPWMAELVPSLPLRIERQVLFWFDGGEHHRQVPLFIWDYEGRVFYTIPDARDHGVKVAFHHGGETTSAEGLRREVSPEEVEDMRRRLARTVPCMDRPPRRSAACMYTNMPDEQFVVGPLPGRPDVLVASPCSGHGFKFAPVIGEILADLVIDGRTRHSIDLFRPDRIPRPE